MDGALLVGRMNPPSVQSPAQLTRIAGRLSLPNYQHHQIPTYPRRF